MLVLDIIDAIHIFTRLLSPLMARLRSEGIRCLIYIDNFFLAAATKQLAREHSKRAFELFAWCGWTFNQAKSSGEPLQLVRFLGLNIDSRDLSYNIPEDKLREIKLKLKKLQSFGYHQVHVKQLAKVVGTLQSLRLATGPLIAVMTRSLYRTIVTADSWNSYVSMDVLSQNKVTWWYEHIRILNKYTIWLKKLRM